MSLYVILIGVQGSGKGVQAAYISDNYGRIPHISTGDLFRAMKTRSDDLARQVQQTMAEGRLVSDDETNAVVRDRLEKPDAQNGAIFDGYPRTATQSAWLEKYLADRGAKINAVLYFQLDLYSAFKRSFGRVSAADKSSYNLYFNNEGVDFKFVESEGNLFPPRLEGVLTATGEKLIRRPDDASAHAIIKRIDTFLETTQPLIEYYRQKGLLREINADRPIEEVSAEVKKVIDGSRS